jgi:hypothetical protein
VVSGHHVLVRRLDILTSSFAVGHITFDANHVSGNGSHSAFVGSYGTVISGYDTGIRYHVLVVGGTSSHGTLVIGHSATVNSRSSSVVASEHSTFVSPHGTGVIDHNVRAIAAIGCSNTAGAGGHPGNITRRYDTLDRRYHVLIQHSFSRTERYTQSACPKHQIALIL